MKSKILLIEGAVDFSWRNALKQALNEIGLSLVTMDVPEGLGTIPWQDFALIIFDAKSTHKLPKIIKEIRSQNYNARIIVFSSAPEYKEATEVMLAGAMDYRPKSLREQDIVLVLKKNLSELPPRQNKVKEKCGENNERSNLIC
jgi:DNA-binding NtrC family response regulator